MALVVAQQVPASSAMAVPHGPSGVRLARRRMREELLASGTPDTVVDDAILILSELLSNACRHARPLHEGAAGPGEGSDARDGAGAGARIGPRNGAGAREGSGGAPGGDVATVRAAWSRDGAGEVTIAVTDGGGPTRPLPAKPSVSARGGRGLAIITALARDWGVRSEGDRPRRAAVAPQRTAADGPAAGSTARGDTLGRGSPYGPDDPCVPYGSAGPVDGAPGVTVWAVLRPDTSFSGRVAASLGGLAPDLGGGLGGDGGEGFDLAAVEEL